MLDSDRGSQDQASDVCFQCDTFSCHLLVLSYVFCPIQIKEGVKPSLPFQDQDKTVTWLEREQDAAPFSPPFYPIPLTTLFLSCISHCKAALVAQRGCER